MGFSESVTSVYSHMWVVLPSVSDLQETSRKAVIFVLHKHPLTAPYIKSYSYKEAVRSTISSFPSAKCFIPLKAEPGTGEGRRVGNTNMQRKHS